MDWGLYFSTTVLAPVCFVDLFALFAELQRVCSWHLEVKAGDKRRLLHSIAIPEDQFWQGHWGIWPEWRLSVSVSQYQSVSDTSLCRIFLGIFVQGSCTAATRAAQQPALAQSASGRGHDSSGVRAGVEASTSFISYIFDVFLMSLVLSAYVWFGFRFGLVFTMVFEAAWLWHCVRIWRSNRKRASHSTLKKLLKKPLRRRSTVHTAIRSVNGLMGNLCAYTPNVSLRSNDARWNRNCWV